MSRISIWMQEGYPSPGSKQCDEQLEMVQVAVKLDVAAIALQAVAIH
jgi:hypothetical protein